MATLKATMLKNILNDAEDAKEIPGMKDTYTPDQYNKLMMRGLVEAELASSDGYLRSVPEEGAIEFDSRGRLKKINRHAPRMLDLSVYTANRYMLEKESHEEPVVSKKTGEVVEGKTTTVYDKFDLLLVLGLTTVTAIDNKGELPKSVKAYRFKRVDKHFEYVKTELISDKTAYEMVNTLNPLDCLRLMQQIAPSDTKSKVGGDSINDLLK